MSKRRRLLGVAVIVVLAAAMLPATLALAAPEKIFSVNMAPGSLTPGVNGQTMTATFKNETPSGNSTINSARLTAAAPAGFKIVTATGSGTETVSADGLSVAINNIPSVKPNKSYVLTMTVDAPGATSCAGDTVNWSANAWTGNASNGDPFRFLPGSSSTTTTMSVSCTLSFSQQPSDAVKGEAIAPAITVTGSPASLFNGQSATLAIADDSPTTATLGGDPEVPFVSGVATFGDITLPTSGDYKLVATSNGYSTGSSATFTISDGILDCGDIATAPGVEVERLENSGGGCVPINYILSRNGNQIQFLKDLTTQTTAQFVIRVNSWDAEAAVNPLPVTQVDTPGGLHDIQWCDSDAQDPSALPGSEVTCLVDQSAAVQPDGKVKVSETYYLFGDILYKR